MDSAQSTYSLDIIDPQWIRASRCSTPSGSGINPDALEVDLLFASCMRIGFVVSSALQPALLLANDLLLQIPHENDTMAPLGSRILPGYQSGQRRAMSSSV